MADKELVKKWLIKADEDFDFASLALAEELKYFPQICWHFQQSAEKYLKAFIMAFDLEFKKIHDLSALLTTCAAQDDRFKALEEECKYLQKFYVETRYPVVWETKHSITDARKAKLAAEKIAKLTKEILV